MTRVLVVTSVHMPDDPRIRHKTAGSLAEAFDVVYATRPPGPTDRNRLRWRPLPGPRPIRAVEALREMLRRDVDVVSVHDPELLPAALVARRLRGVPVVFDVHEDLLARARRGDGIIALTGRVRIRAVERLLATAEEELAITLAEHGYARHFRDPHPVFPNHLVSELLPAPQACDPMQPVVYVGDITPARGVHVLLQAMAMVRHRHPLRLIGRCAPALRHRVEAQASAYGLRVELPGWLPYREAMAAAATAAVGVSPLLDEPNYRHSLPTKVLEYLAVGVPVVASDLPGTSTAIGGLPGVRLVPPANAAALARAIDWAVDPEVRARTRHNVAAVRDAFRWPGAALVDFYREVANRG